MAKARCTIALAAIEDFIFGFSDNPIKIIRVIGWNDKSLMLEISGPDVPEAPSVDPTLTQTVNRVGERLRRIHFKPVLLIPKGDTNG